MISTRASIASGSIVVLVSTLSCSFILASALSQSRLRMGPMSGCAQSRLTHSRSWYWKRFRRKSQLRYRFLLALQTFLIIRREGEMPDKITYYAIIDDLSSRERPAGVLRRTYFESGGRRDEAFSSDLVWERTPILVSAERGDLENEFIEITEDEAN